MNHSDGNRLHRWLRFLLLRGSGWKCRRRLAGNCLKMEWRDPVSGHWYSATKALEILQNQMIADYRPAGTHSRQFSLHC